MLFAAAVKWYTLAAEQGNAYAQYSLGYMFAVGYGAVENYILAHMWANIASANGNSDAQEMRNLIAAQMLQADVTTAQRMASECMASNYENCGY